MFNCDTRRIVIVVVAHIFLAVVYFFSYSPDSSSSTSPDVSFTPVSRSTGADDATESTSNNNNQQRVLTHAPLSAYSTPSSTKSIIKQPSASGNYPRTSGGIFWPELGRTGWVRPTRQRGETSWTCSAVRSDLEGTYEITKKNVNFAAGPKFSMPWFFHDPYPVCGAVLLRHLHGSLDNAPVLRVLTSSSNKMNHHDSSNNDQQQQHLDDRQLRDVFGNMEPAREAIDVTAGVEYRDLLRIEDCGDRTGLSHLLYTARLVSQNFIVAATVDPKSFAVSFVAPAPGLYVLEVKLVHANGTSDNPTVPRSLGVVGIRAVVGGRKAFIYNTKCDYQRHITGSPILLRAHPAATSDASKAIATTVTTEVPLCSRADYQHGFWARITSPKHCYSHSNPFCAGDPDWVTDAAAYNTQYVWVPSEKSHPLVPACKYHYYSPPQGPARSCLRHGDSRAFLYLVGDSVIREYAKNCELLSLRSAKLQCLFANIALEGQHFSNSYAESVAKTIVTNIRENNAGVFATNLGLQHMIGPCTTKQWRIFIRYFVLFWKQQIVWAKSAKPPTTATAAEEISDDKKNLVDGETISLSAASTPSAAISTDEEKLQHFYYAPKYIRDGGAGEFPKLEQAIWIGPPQIQYARKGMGSERAALWDEIAWQELKQLGFQRMRSIPATAPRQESTWDGLHYASERNKVQTVWRNKDAKVYRWSGGVANTLFLMLLNMVCNRS